MIKSSYGWELGFRREALGFFPKWWSTHWNVKVWEVNSLTKGSHHSFT